MRLMALLLFACVLSAQPTITPANITVSVGSTQQFTMPSAKTPYWVISGAGSVNAQTGVYTAPTTLPANANVIIHAQDFAAPFGSAITTFTLTAKPSSAPCACKDGKDGAAAGDIFILSDRPATSVTFSRSPDGTWTAPMQISGGFLAFVQIYRNGARVAEKDISTIIYANGKLNLNAKDSWPASDQVSALVATVSK